MPVFKELGNRAVDEAGEELTGGGGGAGEESAHRTQGGGERQPVGVDVRGYGGLVHELAYGLVGDQVGVQLLGYAVRVLGTQHLARTALMGLQRLVCRF